VLAVLAVLLLLLGLPGLAHAYIDPSAGSVLLQLLLGGLAGVLVALRLYWNRLSAFFRRRQVPAARDERDRIP
jgi:hypothetical protein